MKQLEATHWGSAGAQQELCRPTDLAFLFSGWLFWSIIFCFWRRFYTHTRTHVLTQKLYNQRISQFFKPNMKTVEADLLFEEVTRCPIRVLLPHCSTGNINICTCVLDSDPQSPVTVKPSPCQISSTTTLNWTPAITVSGIHYFILQYFNKTKVTAVFLPT